MISLLSLSLYTSRPIRLGTCDNLYTYKTPGMRAMHLHICAPCDVEQAGIADMQVRGFMSGLIRVPITGHCGTRSIQATVPGAVQNPRVRREAAPWSGEWRAIRPLTHLAVLSNFRGINGSSSRDVVDRCSYVKQNCSTSRKKPICFRGTRNGP